MKPVATPELYKSTPGTNCKECGFSTCLAFATQVISERQSLDTCPYIEEDLRAQLRERIRTQQEANILTKRDAYRDTVTFIRKRLEGVELAARADGLGATYLEENGQPLLRFVYLNRDCLLSGREIFLDGELAGNHWDNILLYNYVHFAGSEPIQNRWIPIDNIPGHVPKKPELEHGCEQKIAEHFEGRVQALLSASRRLAGKPVEDEANADVKLTFSPLPKVPFYVLFWDRDPGEDFPARTKVLFDNSVTAYLDIESLVFLAERFAAALIAADDDKAEGS